jgi:hypothetical protein
MNLDGPIILADLSSSLSPHPLQELALIAGLTAILTPLIYLKGQKDSDRNDCDLDPDTQPVAITNCV